MESYEYSHDEIKNTSIFTWQYSCSRSLWKNSSWVTWKRAAKRHYVEVASMCCTTQCMWLDCVCFENHWKHLVKWLLVLQTCVSHHALIQSGETRLSVTSLNQSLGTMIAKVHIASHSPTLFTQIQLVHNACPTGNLGSMQYSWTHSLMCSSTLLFSTVSSCLLFLVLVSWCVVYRKNPQESTNCCLICASVVSVQVKLLTVLAHPGMTLLCSKVAKRLVLSVALFPCMGRNLKLRGDISPLKTLKFKTLLLSVPYLTSNLMPSKQMDQ